VTGTDFMQFLQSLPIVHYVSKSTLWILHGKVVPALGPLVTELTKTVVS